MTVKKRKSCGQHFSDEQIRKFRNDPNVFTLTRNVDDQLW